MSEKIDIFPYAPRYFDEVLKLANEAFGENYMTSRQLSVFVGSESSFYIAESDGRLAGYCIFIHETPGETAKHMDRVIRLFPKACEPDTKVCYTKSMAIAGEYKSKGIAKKLFGRCLAESVAAGMQIAWGSAWKIGEIVPMKPIFDNEGFSAIGEVPLAWYDNEEYMCLHCGGRCKCGAVIYYKELCAEK
ncbi:hypothetical protein FACS1894191_8800 [Clostridia bacterium]|nr:hypothetical protein FACS1894191_8800 [Clostridia bacterium]